MQLIKHRASEHIKGLFKRARLVVSSAIVVGVFVTTAHAEIVDEAFAVPNLEQEKQHNTKEKIITISDYIDTAV